MEFSEDRKPLIAGAAALAIVAGLGGIVIGRSTVSGPADATAAKEETEEKHGPEGSVEMDAARAKAAGIVTEVTALTALGAEVIAQGTVKATPEGEAALTARADGAITRINKRLGDFVNAGEIVALLDSRDAAGFAADISSASARASAARLAYQRERRLFEAKVTARQDLEAAQTALAEAEAELRRAQSSASAAGAAGGRYLAITSLISGRITKADAKLGNFVSAGTELFRVSDPSRIQVEGAVPASDAKRVGIGDRAVIELPDGSSVGGIVRSATPSLDPDSRSATVVVTPEGSGQLTPGQGVRVRVTTRTGTGDRISLPEEAVQSVEGKDSVFVATAKGFQALPVTTGQRSARRIEIVSGLKGGQRVATRGAFLLKAELGKSEAEH